MTTGMLPSGTMAREVGRSRTRRFERVAGVTVWVEELARTV